MRFEIYLDVDDVLNSFMMPCLRHLGVACGPYDYDLFPKGAGFDVCEAFRRINNLKFEDFPHTSKTIWTVYPGLLGIFRYAPKSRECDSLIQWAIDQVGPNNVYLATKPVSNPKCYYNKAIWVHENLPSILHNKLIIHNEKWKMGSPNRLLIDDSWENCRLWNGPKICLGRPWNDSTHTFESILKGFSVEQQVALFKAGENDA